MTVNHKAFKNDCETVLQEYKTYFFNQFPKHFKEYYTGWSNDMKAILFASEHKHLAPATILDDKITDSQTLRMSSTEQYYFAASVFFIDLIPQVLMRVLGKGAKKLMHQASGWPVMSSGMGGCVSAEMWLQDSGLLTNGIEAEYFNDLLEIILPFHCAEIMDFVNHKSANLSATDYDTLCEAATGKVQAIDSALKEATRNAENNFLSGNIPVYYLTEDELHMGE